tara:strand:+ start:364 stop:570 length:207 start_codon:yes stop_codon:yes gene_type:complete
MRHSIAVWDVTFYKVDEDGEALTDNRGNVQLYNALGTAFTNGTDFTNGAAFAHLAEGLDDDDLEEVTA